MLRTTYDIDAWIEARNRELQHAGVPRRAEGWGICFALVHGGEIFLHTTEAGELLLDVAPQAAWAVPVIAAATGLAAPAGQIWRLPGDMLTQLIFGLNTLISATRPVWRHDFRMRKK